LILFRILQGILNNIMKHADATVTTIGLAYLDGKLHLQINDNGIGFNAGEPGAQQGMGLHNIRKRTGIIGGDVLITSKPGEGTGIAIFTPYP
jgi:two-component system NarL family sensor kinase